MNALVHGLLLGLTITLSFGPGFIAMFQTSIGRGFLSGMVLATGILVSDILLITVSYLGVADFIQQSRNQIILGAIAGSILIGTGVFSVFKKVELDLSESSERSQNKSILRLLLKGFFLNIANPFSLIFWISIMGLAAAKYGSNRSNISAFFAGIVLTAFSSDLLKCYFSGSLKKYLSSRKIGLIHKVAGIVITAIGIALLLKIALGYLMVAV
jgi:threonine/homoserine/homoserine lactone efflux protein